MSGLVGGGSTVGVITGGCWAASAVSAASSSSNSSRTISRSACVALTSEPIGFVSDLNASASATLPSCHL